jgi:DNA-binding NarL/FixJ family response regulator
MTIRTGNAACLPRHPEAARKKTPRLVLGATSLPSVAVTALQEVGWVVTMAASNVHARRLAHKGRGTVVVLHVDGPDESGLLTCAKLVREMPKVRVVLVGPDDEETERFARFAGAAAYLPAGITVETIIRAVTV